MMQKVMTRVMSGLGHVGEGRHEGGGLQALKGIDVQENGLAGPVQHGGGQHAVEDGALDLLVAQGDDDEQTEEHGDDGQHHLGVHVAHGLLGVGGGQRAEEVTHGEEGAAVGAVEGDVGTQADVHQHQADGGADAQAHAEGNGLHDLLADIEEGQDDEHEAFHKDDDQSGLESFGVAHLRALESGQGNDAAHDHGKEAVEAHAGSHGEGLVGEEGHADGADGGCDAGGQEHAVPKRGAHGEAGQQVGVQGDDVGHRHEGGQTCHDLRADVGAVFLQLEYFLHVLFSPPVFLAFLCLLPAQREKERAGKKRRQKNKGKKRTKNHLKKL